jgi:flagellar biosynthesis protein FliR
MVVRIASVLSLIAFAVCLLVGGLVADNPLTTTVGRALLAMMATMVIGLILGWCAAKMIEENLKSAKDKMKNNSPESSAVDR